ncbi:hypothetical protein PF008_g6563 [Phytophthora fragariae]|uniref:RxLR effector protein n=1 Tax=Phytophthora fragariae TaxID=53985 RepID=A0A6G0S539_9STRA|nr:hypothetical protein PF008_g6563 [Phytophthora fragariae]
MPLASMALVSMALALASTALVLASTALVSTALACMPLACMAPARASVWPRSRLQQCSCPRGSKQLPEHERRRDGKRVCDCERVPQAPLTGMNG